MTSRNPGSPRCEGCNFPQLIHLRATNHSHRILTPSSIAIAVASQMSVSCLRVTPPCSFTLIPLHSKHVCHNYRGLRERVCVVWLRVWLGGAGWWGWVSFSCSPPALSSPPTARFYLGVNKRCSAVPLEKLPCHCFLCTSPQPLLSSSPVLLSLL